VESGGLRSFGGWLSATLWFREKTMARIYPDHIKHVVLQDPMYAPNAGWRWIHVLENFRVGLGGGVGARMRLDLAIHHLWQEYR
jgi:hypothetical protein